MMTRFRMMLFMPAVKRHTDEDGGQQGENVGLQKRYKQFEHIDEQRHRYGYKDPDQYRLQNEDQPDQGKDHDVTRGHIGKKSDAERERFCEEPDELHRHHDHDQNRFHRYIHIHLINTAHEMSEIADHTLGLHRRILRHEKGANRQCCRNSNIAGGRGTVGNEAEKITEQNEEKDGKEIINVGIGLLTEVRPYDLFPDENNNRLEKVIQASGNEFGTGQYGKDQKQKYRHHPHHDDMFGRRKIDRHPADLNGIEMRQFDHAKKRQFEFTGIGDVMEDGSADVHFPGFFGRLSGGFCPFVLGVGILQ